MKVTASAAAILLCLGLYVSVKADTYRAANTYGSVEPIANEAVIDTAPLRDQPLRVREAFASRLLQCGIVSRTVDALTSTGAISTINDLNTHFAVGGKNALRGN